MRLHWRLFNTLLILLVLLAGCATMSQPPGRTAKHCSDSPQGAVVRFLEGIIWWSLAPIRLVIAEGTTILGVFGGGDAKKGWEIAKQLYHHPEVLDGISEAGIQRLEPVELAELGNGETRVLLEREDAVSRYADERRLGDPREVVEKKFRRNFAVRFQEGTNCITAVRAMDPKWVRTE